MRKFIVTIPMLLGTPLYGVGFVGVGYANYWRSHVTPSVDSGVVVCSGYTVFKVNPSGSVAWARELSSYCEGVFTYSGGYMVVDGSGSDVHIHALRADGSDQWGYSYTLPGGNNYVRDLVISGGNLIFLFATYLSSGYYPLLLSLSSSGAVNWAKSYGVSGNINSLVAYGGGYVISLMDSLNYIVLVEVDGSGNVSSALELGVYSSVSGSNVIGMVVVGGNLFVSVDNNLVKLDGSLNTLWVKEEDYQSFAKLEGTDGSNLYLFGEDQLIKMDASGNVLWAKVYEYSLNMYYHDLALSGGRLYAVGSPNALTDSLAVISVSTDGNLPCGADRSVSYSNSTSSPTPRTVSSQNRTVTKGSSVSTSSTSYTLNLRCVSLDVSEASKDICGKSGEIYDISGRRYGKIPDRPGIYFIVTRRGAKKVIRR